MSDLIDRQAAIDTLENTKTAISENGERYIAKQNAIMRIDALPSAQPKLLQPWEVLAAQSVLSQPSPHWIPVTERLPEVNGCYLVSVKNDHERRYSKTAWFGKGVWFARQDVIAWMPLPEPFKGVTE